MSVVIPTHNRGPDLLERSVRSALAQDYEPLEVVVVDDNASGSPLSREIRAYCESLANVRYIRQDGNRGACAARNLGVHRSAGEFLAFLDDDDEWKPEKTRIQMERFRDGVGAVFCKGYIVGGADDSPVQYEYYNSDRFKREVGFSDLLRRDHVGSTSQVIVRRDCFLEVGGFDDGLPARQDYDLWLRIGRRYTLIGVDEHLFIHHLHEGEQISKSYDKVVKAYRSIYEKYRADLKEDRHARANMAKRIVAAARRSRQHRLFLTFLVTLLWLDPLWVVRRVLGSNEGIH